MNQPPADEVLLIGEALGADTELRAFLTKQGCRVRSAADPLDGLAAARAQRPAVVLVQQELGEGDALEVIKQLRREAPASETILVTTTGEMELAIQVLRAGALDYLRRPIDLAQLQVALARARDRRPSRAAMGRPVLLAVDDHEPTLRRLCKVLDKEGYEVLAAANGKEALQVFHSHRVDVLLADLRMPYKDGLTVLREIKGSGADVEAIVMTGYGDEDTVVRALREGAIDFLRKPIDIEQMLSAIQKALEHQRVRRSLSQRDREAGPTQELVLRLTERSELVVEPPTTMSAAAGQFLLQLTGALRIGVVVADEDHQILFASERTGWTSAAPQESLTVEWLGRLGEVDLSQQQLEEALQRTLKAAPATMDTLPLSDWSVLVLTPVRLIRRGGSKQLVALAIVGERSSPAGIIKG